LEKAGKAKMPVENGGGFLITFMPPAKIIFLGEEK
jgi:hypothetical protein